MVKQWIGCLVVLAVAGCGPKANDPVTSKRERKEIFTTSYPLAYVAQRLVGNRAEVVFPAPADVDPVFWVPDEAMVRRYQQADLILLNGAGGEKWTKTVTLPLAKTVDTAASLTNEWLMFKEVITHSHGPQGAHSHGNIDFNTWLDPVMLARQAVVVESALRRLLPETDAETCQRGAQLRDDLKKLDAQLSNLTVPALLASHPVYNYLAKRCRWNLQSVHWEPGEDVTAAQWAEFDALRAKHPAKIMLWEGEPLPAVRAELEKRGVRVVVFETCGNTPATGDYLSTMQTNTKRLAAALTKVK